jgi:hypothetical protein
MVGPGIIVGALCSYGFQKYHGESFKSWQVSVFGLPVKLTSISLMEDHVSHLWSFDNCRRHISSVIPTRQSHDLEIKPQAKDHCNRKTQG